MSSRSSPLMIEDRFLPVRSPWCGHGCPGRQCKKHASRSLAPAVCELNIYLARRPWFSSHASARVRRGDKAHRLKGPITELSHGFAHRPRSRFTRSFECRPGGSAFVLNVVSCICVNIRLTRIKSSPKRALEFLGRAADSRMESQRHERE